WGGEELGGDGKWHAKPRARVYTKILQRQRQESCRHLLARRGDDVILARIVQAAGFAGPRDQLVGRPRHRRNNHRDLAAAIDFAFDTLRDFFDALDVGDRGTAELLNNTRHATLEFYPAKISAKPAPAIARVRVSPHTLFRSIGP